MASRKKGPIKKVLIVYEKEEWEEEPDGPQPADVFEDTDSAVKWTEKNGIRENIRFFEVEVISELKVKREYTVVKV